MSESEGVEPLWDEDAERAVLGSIFLDNETLHEVADALAPDDFMRESHRSIFAAMLGLAEQATPIDYVTVGGQLRTDGTAQNVSVTVLTELDTLVPANSSVKHYAQIVRDLSMRRQALKAYTDGARAIRDRRVKIENLIGNAQEALGRIQDGRRIEEFVPFATKLGRMFDNLSTRWEHRDQFSGIRTGLTRVDEKTSGFRPGELVILGGTPGAGKTSLAISTALKAALVPDAGPVLVFEQEMEDEQVMHRAIAAEARVRAIKFRDYDFSGADFPRVSASMNRIYQANIDIQGGRQFTLHEVRARCRRARLHFKKNPSLVVVDYLQALESTNPDPRESEEAQIRGFAKGLKSIALEFKCVVLALSQLNRKYEDRSDKKPSIGDLRGSGQIAAWADAVLLLHRPGLTEGDHESTGECEVIIAKHRYGATGKVSVTFEGEFTAFSDQR